ncbi:endonuclease/exonuclease/phosphatase family protein [Halomonas sp. ISL-60]|uniref:endonuclease/exonuclease/phosphatase family protein n=1 Tax=Halomonas sp. ISL-56 TaxID=2819149 RepID=UPI001BE70A56|nr:endonuclease/exonuclease/phosphatase family protein [Halomonas sp. ISL-56]MBT2774733.1 endonuclease/exonuclease/phosphatase family protein [Halomonas sp. ISL-60]MBT2802325.1 endonuclease/exonuclease/phosphatase family protein [Halomonas sp. ISL-56]
MLLKLLLWVIRLLVLLMVVVALLPLIPSGQWWIRLWDFPRLQLTGALVLPVLFLGVHAWLKHPTKEHALWGVAILAIAGWHLTHILPFTSVWSTEVDTAELKPGENQTTLKVLTANVTYTNDHYAEVMAMVRREDPDLLLLIEVDSDWAKELAPLDEAYAHRVGEVRGEGLGIVLWSRMPLLEQEVRYLASERRPSIFATFDAPGIGPVRFVGAHPVPPGLKERTVSNEDERRDSRERDAELMLIARHVEQDPDSRWIVTGDFNDVAWSDTTKLFAELSDLKDPRRGRRLLSTYHAKYPWWRYPIDHLFVSDGFHLIDIDRVKVQGSDHFGLSTTLTVGRKDHGESEASAEEEQEAEEMIEEGVEDAAEHDVSSSQTEGKP